MYCPPPSLAQALQREREEESCRESSHSLTVCMLCGSAWCLDCWEMKEHAAQHGGRMLFLLLSDGCLLYQTPARMWKLPSVYKDKLMQRWSSTDRDAEGYHLDKEELDSLTTQFLKDRLLGLVEGQLS